MAFRTAPDPIRNIPGTITQTLHVAAATGAKLCWAQGCFGRAEQAGRATRLTEGEARAADPYRRPVLAVDAGQQSAWIGRGARRWKGGRLISARTLPQALSGRHFDLHVIERALS